MAKKLNEPYACGMCGAWVFTSDKLHAPVCHLYRGAPEMVENTKAYYESQKLEPKQEKPVKKARKKKA